MIIDGHPDILLGPRGLNGLHGFGSLPPEGASPAYIRFMPENGGLGIDALYQEIRDFVSTHSQAEIQQAMNASGVSDDDVRNAMYGMEQGYDDVKNAMDRVEQAYTAEIEKAKAARPIVVVNSNPYGYSAAYMRFLPENGGLGIDALYQEIRDFVSTHSQAEIQQAMNASGVSDDDVRNAMYGMEQGYDDVKNAMDRVEQAYTAEIEKAKAARPIVVVNSNPYGYSAAYMRFLPENGGLGIDALYQEIRDFVSTHSQAEIKQAMDASGVSSVDVENALKEGSYYAQPPIVAQTVTPPVEPPHHAQTYYEPPAQPSRNREIVDFVMTHSDAEIRAQMVISNVSQDGIINAFKSFDPTKPNGQSPAYARSLPENGGAGVANFYREINDFVQTHSFYEVLSQMFRSEVSMADVQAANTYEFFKSPSGGGAGEADALAVAQQAAREAAAAAKREADAVVAREAYLADMARLEAAIAAEQAAAVARAAQLAAAEQAAAAIRIAAIEKDQARRNAEQAAAAALTKQLLAAQQAAEQAAQNAALLQRQQMSAAATAAAAAAAAAAKREADALAASLAAQQEAATRAAQEAAASLAAQQAAATRAAQAAAASLAAQQAAATRAAQEAAASLAAQQAAAQAAADLRAAQQAAASYADQQAAALRAAQAEAALRAAQQQAAAAEAESRAQQEAAAQRAAAAAQASARAAQEVADARAKADALAAQAAQAAQQQNAIQAELAAQEAAAAAAAAQKASDQAAAAIAIAQASAAAVTTKTEQSEAYTRFLPENGGQGIDALYREIRDFVSTHTDAEIKQTAAASGVSNTDIVKAVSQTQQATATAVASSAAKATAAATAAAGSAATAAAIAVAKSPEQSQAYTKFLPENGGKGITALYKQISDFVSVSTPAEIKDAMIKGGISEEDVLNALKVFPKKVVETTGVSFPYIAAAAALALFVLVKK
jgi:translation elongation factor EF-1beta